MPNNFKLGGDYYVSKAGSDSNDGLTPDTPKRTIQAALSLVTAGSTRRIIIGTGVYSETLSATFGSVTNVTFLSDGYVVLDGRNQFSISFWTGHTSTPSQFNFYNLEIRNYGNISLFNTTNGTGGTYHVFFDCKFYNNIINQYRGNTTISSYNRCIFVYTNFSFLDSSINIASLAYNSCIFINSKMLGPFYAPTSIINCYVDPYSNIIARSSISAASFNYNNIQGFIIMSVASTVTSGVIQDTYGRYYDLSIATSTGDGTEGNKYGRPYTAGAGFNFPNHRIAYPTMNASSSAVDPGFNNILKQDFTLQSSSFMVGRAQNFIDNIGGTYVATRLDASGSSFSGSNATVDTLVFAPFSDYVISGSAVTGSVTSAPIFISSSAKVIQEIDYNGLLAFNKDTTAPTGSNVNVPDVLTYTSASNQPGANPDRLTYYMRWTTGSSQPVSDAQWENGGLWPAGSFNTFEWNTKPSVDFLGRGNGDQNFNIINTPTFVKATWIQLRVTLRNDYLI